jgi:hypothetical protein
MKKAALLIFIFMLCLPFTAEAVILGPYTGTVTDSTSGKPIEGASVLFYWTKEVPAIEGPDSYNIDAALVYTNGKGEYHLPRKIYSLGLMGSLKSTNVIIYEPGYQAYMERVWHKGRYYKKESQFREKDYTARLERIPPNFNHKDHVNRIREALRDIDDRYYSYGNVTWQKRLKSSIGSRIEERELLRRTEWEKIAR